MKSFSDVIIPSILGKLNKIAFCYKYHNKNNNHDVYTFLSIFSTEEGSLVVKEPYFRNCYQSEEPVLSIIGRKMPETAILAFTAISFAIVIGIVLGILSAVKRGSWLPFFTDSPMLFLTRKKGSPYHDGNPQFISESQTTFIISVTGFGFVCISYKSGADRSQSFQDSATCRNDSPSLGAHQSVHRNFAS